MPNASDHDDAILAASSGRGHRCTGTTGLLAFSERLKAQDAWIDIVETFEIADCLEIPRIELSIYGDHGAYDLPTEERRKLAADRLAGMIRAVGNEPGDFCFDVWLDKKG